MPKKLAKQGSFSPAELVAIGGAVKDKALKEAKGGLLDGSVTPIDMTVRIQGNVTKGHSSPPVSSFGPPEISFFNAAAICALMGLLGMNPRKLREALKDMEAPKFWAEDPELMAVFADVAAAIAKKQPEVQYETPGKAGSCSAPVTITRV